METATQVLVAHDGDRGEEWVRSDDPRLAAADGSMPLSPDQNGGASCNGGADGVVANGAGASGEGELDVPTACMAKYWVTELQGEVVDKCLQFHGGAGFINDYPIARMYRDSRVTRIFGGSNEVMKMVISRSM